MRARASLLALLPLIAALTACGPVPVDQAEQSCLRDARLAERPRGHAVLGVGGGSGGTHSFGRVELEVSGDYLMRRDPTDVFARCVTARSGQLPTRPLSEQPGWSGAS